MNDSCRARHAAGRRTEVQVLRCHIALAVADLDAAPRAALLQDADGLTVLDRHDNRAVHVRLLAQVQPRAGVCADGRGDSAVSAIQVLCQHVAGFAVHADTMPFAACFDDFHQCPGGVLPQHLRVQRRGFAQVQRAALDERALGRFCHRHAAQREHRRRAQASHTSQILLVHGLLPPFAFHGRGCAFEAAFLSASPIQRQGADVRCWRILGDLADALEEASDSS